MRTVLVANRGEIARRVFATCRRMGLATVAVYSPADVDSPHVADADAAVPLPGDRPDQSYLCLEALLAAATAAGADAVHPGYGFLSENADFAQAVADAGLVWVGPPAPVIARMAEKIAAKALMREAGVPVLPQLDPTDITAAQLPVLIKASAGGGGRGMRIVHRLDQLPAQWDAAGREAHSAFGNATVFCEPYLAAGHHIEVQILADSVGTVWTVGERECSIQRRHQKVVEETPSPLVQRLDGKVGTGSGMRQRIFAAARTAAAAVGYRGAGTVEFLADGTGAFYFLEMNTRLQVEHPVTECTTGLDLVQWQLLIAQRQRLPAQPPVPRGHAIEVRLYAEDPAEDWRPGPGTVRQFQLPAPALEFANPAAPGIRLDSSVVAGSVVGVLYDPMLAKLVSYAETRDEAATLLAATLRHARIHGPVTNRDLLVRILEHPAFRAGETDTSFFATHGLAALAAPLVLESAAPLWMVAAALSDAAAQEARRTVAAGLPAGWRNLPGPPQSKTYSLHSSVATAVQDSSTGPGHEVQYRYTRDGIIVEDYQGLEVVQATEASVVLVVPENGGRIRRQFAITHYDDVVVVDGAQGSVVLRRVPRFGEPRQQVAAGSLQAPLPGVVVRVAATVGDPVRRGQAILHLEAMKMEHVITAPADGVVTELFVAAGQHVDVGARLAIVLDADRQE